MRHQIIHMSGSEFRKLRKQLKMRQDALGEILGRSRQHISRLENQDAVPVVYALAIRQLEALKINVAA